MNLTQIQKYYFEKIENNNIKELLKISYTFFTMDDEEKDDLLTWASQIHLDPKAEKSLINLLKKEAKESVKLVQDPPVKEFTKQERQEQLMFFKKQYAEIKSGFFKLKKAVKDKKSYV
jgi:isopenicillin N synthase-like dioxygenase